MPSATSASPDPQAHPTLEQAAALFHAGEHAAAYRTALPLAEGGDHRAQRLVGNLLAMGTLGQPDVAAARPWWERAALTADPAAQYNLGLSYLDPDAPGGDPALARGWLMEAAQGGHVDAMTRLGAWELGEAGDDLARAASGYRWLRIAERAGAPGARMAIERALRASSWDDPARLEALRAAALRLTPSHQGATGADLLRDVDRGEPLSYHIALALSNIAGKQGLVENAFTANPTKPSPMTLADIAHNLSEDFAEHLPPGLPPDTVPWVLGRRGLSYPDVEVVTVPPDRLWDLVRPGDVVELSDGLSSHVTTTWSIDRAAGTIRFLDAWPDQFLLLPGLNALGADARAEPYGRTRRWLSVTRADFVQAARGLVSVVGARSVDALWRGVPELHGDPAAALALASVLARSTDPDSAARGLGWLVALLRGDGPAPLPRGREGAAADRAWLAAERLRRADPGRRVACASPGATVQEERLASLVQELDRRWPPRLDSLSARVLADEAWRRASAGDLDGAEALLQPALRHRPQCDLLRLARAGVWIARGTLEPAARELGDLIPSLEERRTAAGPLVRTVNDTENGVATARPELAGVEVSALALQAQARMGLRQPRAAVEALQLALDVSGQEHPELLTRLAEAADAAGDAALATAARDRLRQAKYRKLLDGVLGNG